MQAPQPRSLATERMRHAAMTLLVALHLASCAHTEPAPGPTPASPPAAAAQPAPPAPAPKVAPRPWADEILYFVIVDRFADGDSANNAGVEPTAQGAFHGGDLKGLRQQLDELSSLGVTALSSS